VNDFLEGMMRCPHCGQEHPSNVSYCPTTGQPLPSSRGFQSRRLIVALICIAILGVGGLLIWIISTTGSEIRVTVQTEPGESLNSTELLNQVACQGALTQDAISSTETTLPAWDNPGYFFSTPPSQSVAYPHWVNYIHSLLDPQYDLPTINSGLTVHTTLDPWLQDKADQILRKGLDGLSQNRVTNGALVAIRPSTGEILAMVGSADYNNQAINGQVNMAINPRQPGTTIKPLVYTAAFEKGWTASTLIWDVLTEFPPSGDVNDARPPYVPANYDGRFHGPVTVRSALANSHNIPAVKALQFAGIYDDPNIPQGEGLLGVSQRLGITTLKRDDYGISLTLGGGEVSLLELTGAYAVIANGGNRIPSTAIKQVNDAQGNMLYQYQAPLGDQVVSPELAYLISSILSDNEARTPMFGANSVLNLPFQVAAKTGTTNDFRDIWTLGYTPDLAVGVWVGNTDYSPMVNTTGLTGAAPIWAEFMQAAIPYITDGNPTSFSRPASIAVCVVCTISGTEPSEWCPQQRMEYFAADQLPLPASQDLWQRVYVDTWIGLRASEACGGMNEVEFVLNVSDPWAIQWIEETAEGRAWAEQVGFKEPILFMPARDCAADDPRPILNFYSLQEGETYQVNPLPIVVLADATAGFDFVRLEYGMGRDPVDWNMLVERDRPIPEPEEIYKWDLSEMPEGLLTLRLFMESTEGTYAEKRLYLEIDH
jgi:hypothetical protein